jgi:defect-in-organelle-trafficking protein DotB
MATRQPISLLKGENNAAETWPDEPVRFLEEHVDPFLLWCIEKGSSDVTIQSDRPVYNEISGKLYPGTYRPLDSAEMAAFLNRIYGPEALAKLASADDLDLSYEIRPNRYERHRFRVNITAVLSKGRDAAQITMRVLPSDPPNFTQLGVEDEIIKNWAPRQGMVVVQQDLVKQLC